MSERHAIACEAGAKALDRYRPGTNAAQMLRDLAGRIRSPIRDPAKPLKSDFATQKEEITRKALTALEAAQVRFEAGEITARDMWFAADAIYDTVSGLVDWDIAQLVYAVRQQLKEHAPE